MLHLELIWIESHQVMYLLILQVKFLVGDPSKGHGGHSRSPTVFLQITWEPNKIETWNCCHCVCLRNAHRMMYNLTYLGHRMTLPWLDLRSNFDLDLSRSNYTWFDAPWREKHDGIKIVALPLNLKILSSKNRFGKFWNFDPWWPQFWPEPKNDRNDFEMIFRELSNAAFRFVLRCAGAEIEGGGVQTPPPSRSWKIQRPSRARVNLRLAGGGVKRPHVFRRVITPIWRGAAAPNFE